MRSVAVFNNSLPTDGLSFYIKQSEQFPVLTETEEKSLVTRFLEFNDKQAAQQLVLSHLRYVVYIAKKHLGYGLPLADLVQEGTIGLMKAVKGFRPSEGVRLVTYAVTWIKSAIQDFVIRQWRLVKVATTKAQRKLFFNLRRYQKEGQWLSLSEKQKIAGDLNVPVYEVSAMESRLYGQDTPFDLPANNEDEFTPSDWLTSPESQEPLAQLCIEEDDARRTVVRKALMQLDSRAKRIIEARWLNPTEKLPFKTLAEELGVSIERVRQLEKRAIESIQKAVSL